MPGRGLCLRRGLERDGGHVVGRGCGGPEPHLDGEDLVLAPEVVKPVGGQDGPTDGEVVREDDVIASQGQGEWLGSAGTTPARLPPTALAGAAVWRAGWVACLRSFPVPVVRARLRDLLGPADERTHR